jgi:hypothetical protein
MSDYIFLIVLIILLISYLFYFKEKLIKWEQRDSIEKSYANNLIAILVAGILLWIYKIMNS